MTMSIDADEHGTLHLHGYDIEIDLGPDETSTMEFTADATGRFNITFHPGEEEHEDGSESPGAEQESEAGGNSSGHERDDEEGEEIPIGALEVQPR